MIKKYAQIKTLVDIFDLSEDWFKNRMATEEHPDKPFKKGLFYFIPDSQSATKKAVLWDIEVVEAYIRGELQTENSAGAKNKKVIANILKC
jgi:hypothetical protein